MAFLLGDGNKFVAADLRAFVDRMTLVTRGPLLDPARWREIVRFNLGLHDHLIDRDRYRVYHPVPWDEATAVRPDFVQAYLNRADDLHQAGDLEGALVRLEEAVRRDPHNAIAANNLGWLYQYHRHAPGTAATLYERAVAGDPEFADARVNLGNVYIQLGEFEKARETLLRAREMAPSVPEVHYNLGNAEAALGEPAKALDAFRRAITLRPDYAEAWYGVGRLHLRQGRRQQAVEALNRAARLGSRAARDLLQHPGLSH
jgi:tetratricopeptide (TPR) repeat protein